MKLIVLFSSLALTGLAAFALGVALDTQPLTLFAFAVSALVLLVIAGDYEPRTFSRRSRAAVLVPGLQRVRARVPAAEWIGYGSALGAGVMIILATALTGIITYLIYMQEINLGISELVMQAQASNWAAAGLSNARLEQAKGLMQKMMNPAIQVALGFCLGMFFSTLISLVTTVFLKRPARDDELQSYS